MVYRIEDFVPPLCRCGGVIVVDSTYGYNFFDGTFYYNFPHSNNLGLYLFYKIVLSH